MQQVPMALFQKTDLAEKVTDVRAAGKEGKVVMVEEREEKVEIEEGKGAMVVVKVTEAEKVEVEKVKVIKGYTTREEREEKGNIISKYMDKIIICKYAYQNTYLSIYRSDSCVFLSLFILFEFNLFVTLCIIY